jgi:hypothetical protein
MFSRIARAKVIERFLGACDMIVLPKLQFAGRLRAYSYRGFSLQRSSLPVASHALDVTGELAGTKIFGLQALEAVSVRTLVGALARIVSRGFFAHWVNLWFRF